MTAGGGPEHGRPGGDRRDAGEAPPWERPGLPSWLPQPTGTGTAAGPPAHRRGRRAALAVVLSVVIALLAGGGALVATKRGDEQGSGNPTTNAFGTAGPGLRAGGTPASSVTGAAAAPQTEAEIRARLERVRQRLTEVRGLPFKRDVPSVLLPTAKLQAQVLREVDEDTDEARLRAEGRALELLGQLPPGTDLVGLMRRTHAESVVGYYTPGKDGKLYVRAQGGLTPFAEYVLSHELTHALTDQHFDLGTADRLEAEGGGDRLLGYLALVEGDATFTMQRYYAREMSPAEQLSVAQESLEQRTPVLDGAPDVVKQSLGFPYQAGMIFVQALHQRGGWRAVNRAYSDPPTSSEQVLHPERYLVPRDEPQRVTVPDLRSSLGKGWRAGVDTGWGEADARFLLAEQVPVTAANEAAAGWDGGRLRTFERGGHTALALRTVWDSAEEATEFCETMSRWAIARFGQPRAGASWAGGNQHTALLCAGTRATWLSAPDAATLERLRGGLGGKP